MTSEEWILVNNLSKRFNDFYALKDISFKSKKGEITALLGLNGAGKTTTLRILSTLIKPTSGSAKILEFDVLKSPLNVKRYIGVLPSEANLPGRFTPFELSKMVKEIYKICSSKFKENFEFLVEELKMGDYIHKRINFFSLGMKQKTSLMLSFLHNPPVLLLDEPTAGLDVVSSVRIREFLKKNKKGKCVLVSSHHLKELEEFCDKVIIIHEGRIISSEHLNKLKALNLSLEKIFIDKVLKN
jgi:sodium transport system ATP-binding protein